MKTTHTADEMPTPTLLGGVFALPLSSQFSTTVRPICMCAVLLLKPRAGQAIQRHETPPGPLPSVLASRLSVVKWTRDTIRVIL